MSPASSAPEARKERLCQSYSASHIKWRGERSFHRPTFIRPVQRFREVRFTFRSAHHLFNTISLQQAHRLRQCMKTSCKRCFMAIQLQEVFFTSIWPRHKVQWVALNVSLQRKSFAEWCALSQAVEAAKKIDHDLVNREFSNKVVKKWLWETLRLTFVSNICHYTLYSAL